MRDQPTGFEHQLFQLVVIIAAVVPVSAGVAGIWRGPEMIRGIASSSADLESHFRYLSGLLLGIGLAFVFSVLDIQHRASLFRVLGMIVIAGGLARLRGWFYSGFPGPPICSGWRWNWASCPR